MEAVLRPSSVGSWVLSERSRRRARPAFILPSLLRVLAWPLMVIVVILLELIEFCLAVAFVLVWGYAKLRRRPFDCRASWKRWHRETDEVEDLDL